MSRAQGDGYRTWTDHKLNEYRAMLDAKLDQLMDYKIRWYENDGFWILTESHNKIHNPNGSWKWNGWEITGREYRICVFEGADIEVKGGDVRVRGCSILNETFTDRDEANDFFRQVMA